MLQQIRLEDGESLTVPGIVPKLSRTPGGQHRNAPALGQDTEAVLREVGVSEEQIAALRSRGVISTR
jgi:formyl-CoA transferase